MKKKSLLGAIGTLTGTAIGAGFLGLPYVISKVGLFFGLLEIVFIGLLMLYINLLLGEITLRTKGFHQLTGYASKYLGKLGKGLMLFSMIFGIYTAVIAYLLAEGELLSFLFFSSLKYSFVFSILFFFFVAFLVYKGIKILERGEGIALVIVLFLVVLITAMFAPKLSLANLRFISSTNPFFLVFYPFGVTLFSFLAFSAMPELEQELARNKRLMKKTIILGSIIPIIVYLIFVFIVVGYAGKATPEIATFALGKLPCLLAVFTMFTACFALSSALRDMYRFDFNFSYLFSFVLSLFPPLIIYILIAMFNLASFVKILSLSGVFAGGVAGIVISVMALKAKELGERKPEYKIRINKLIVALLILLFIAAMISEFVF